MATLIALLAAAALSAQPAKMVLGKDASADLTLRAPAGAKVTWSTSVGTVSDASRAGDAWHAKFNPPSLHSPSVALVLAQVDEDGDRELHWLAIPLSGSDTLEVETRPGSEVVALVAGARIGPITADQNGAVRLPMVVPPGVSKGTLRITDKLGNTNEKPLDLEPPPFARVRMATRSEAATVASPLEVEIFVVRPDGTPDDHANIELDADDGEMEVRKPIGPGVYLARYLAPEGKTGSAHLEANVGGKPGTIEVPVRPSNVKMGQTSWPSALVAQRPWSVSLGVIGGLGGSFDGAGAGSLGLEAAMRLQVLPLEALLEGGVSSFTEVSQGAGPGTTNAQAHAWLLQAGLRAGRQLVRGLDGHIALLAGAQSQVVHVRSIVLPAGSNDSSWVARVAVALGANMRLGPGRALAQVQFDASPPRQAGLEGSLGGVQLQIGYLVTVR